MVELAVNRAIDDIASGNMRRELRKLVDYGRHFSTGTFPHDLFTLLLTMLSEKDHPYFAVAERAIAQVDRRYVTDFEINLGYESMSLGAGALRHCHDETGCWLPWILGLDPAKCRPDLLTLPMEKGVKSFILLSRDPNPVLVSAFCHAAPRAAFFLAAPDAAFTEKLLSALRMNTNLCYIPVRRDGTFVSGTRFRQFLLPYTPCRILDEKAAKALMAEDDLWAPGDPEAFCLSFFADKRVSDEVRKAFDDFLIDRRLHPTKPLIPLEVGMDILGVERVMARDPSAAFSVPDEYDLSAFMLPGPGGSLDLEFLL